MKNLVQLALAPQNPHSRGVRQGQHVQDHGFGDILQLKSGKGEGAGPTAADETAIGSESAPAPLSAFQLKIVGHRPPDEGSSPKWLHMGDRLGRDEGPIRESAEETSVELPDEMLLAQEQQPIAREQPILANAKGAEQEAPESKAEASDLQPLAGAAGAPAAAAVRGGIRTGRAESGDAVAQSAGVVMDADETPRITQPDAAKAAGRPTLERAAADPTPPAPAIAGERGGRHPGEQPATPGSAAKPSIGDAQAFVERTAPVTEKRPDAPRLSAGVRVVEAHSLPAPPQIASPAAAVTGAIAAAPDWIFYARPVATAATALSSTAAPVRALTIQLHPAELGVVTAKLRFAGEQLSIELQAEKGDAYDRLSMDRDAILKAVRALGIEVDKVTVQQSQAQAPVHARGENAGAFNGGGRDAGFSAQAGSDGRGSGETPGRSRGGHSEAQAQTSGGAHGAQNADSSGLYI